MICLAICLLASRIIQKTHTDVFKDRLALMWENRNDFAWVALVTLEEALEWRVCDCEALVQTLNENFMQTQAEGSPIAELDVTRRPPKLSSKSQSA